MRFDPFGIRRRRERRARVASIAADIRNAQERRDKHRQRQTVAGLTSQDIEQQGVTRNGPVAGVADLSSYGPACDPGPASSGFSDGGSGGGGGGGDGGGGGAC